MSAWLRENPEEFITQSLHNYIVIKSVQASKTATNETILFNFEIYEQSSLHNVCTLALLYIQCKL